MRSTILADILIVAAGAAHIKISDHSWHNVHSFTPLLPVHRVMAGKPKIARWRKVDFLFRS